MKVFRHTLVSLAVLLISGTAAAQQPAAPITFNMAAQAMPDALNQWAQTTEFQLIFPQEYVESGVVAPGLVGSFTPEEALQKLLSNTDLGYVYVNDRTIAIRSAKRKDLDSAKAPPPSTARIHRLQPAQAPAPSEAEVERASGGLQEITVTSRRRAENVQDVPISVQAYSGEQMELKGFERVENVLRSTPNVMIGGGPAGQASPTFAMRGIPGAGVFIDGVFQQTLIGFGQRSVVEVDRIEVLRGPQGTLFGRDTTGGAVRIFTKLPASELGVRAEATFGSYDRHDLALHADVPLHDTLLSKFSFASEQRDGYVRSVLTGRATGEIDDRTLRADFLWLPNNKLTARLWADATRQRSTQPQYTVYVHDFGPPGPSPGGGFTVPPYQYYAALGHPYDCKTVVARCPGGQIGDLESASDYNGGPGVEVDDKNISLKLDYKLTANLAISSLTHFSHVKSWFLADIDNSWFDFWSHGVANRRESWSQELQFTGELGRFHFVAGLYGWTYKSLQHDYRWSLFDFDCGTTPGSGQAGGCSSRPRFTFAQLQATPFCQNVVPPNAPCARLSLTSADFMSESKQEGVAAFGELTLDITRTLSLTLGGRYHDQTDDDWTLVPAADTPRLPDTAGVLPAGDVFKHADRILPLSFSFSKATYRAALSNKFTDAFMAYAGFSQGYTGGGTTRVNIPDAQGVLVPTDFPYAPEEINNYEIGLRSAWLDRTLRLNLTVFHTDWKRIQISGTLRNPLTGEVLPVFVTQNAASAEAQGAEIEASWRPIAHVTFDLGVGLLDTGYTKILPSVASDIEPDSKFGNAPRTQGSFGAQYTSLMRYGGSMLFRVDYNYTSGYNRTYVPGDQRGNLSGEKWEQHAFALLAARIMYTAPSERWSLALFGTNLTDERYSTGGFFSPLLLFDDGTIGRPREYGLTFKAYF